MVLLLAVLVLLPLFWLALTSVQDDAKIFTLAHYRQLFVDPAFVRPLWTTLWTSAAVGLGCIIAAAPMAWLVSRTDLPGKRWWRTLILASFVTPPFLGAFAWVLLGGPNAGLINQAYYALLGLKPFDAAPLVNVFSAWGMVFVMALYTFPYVFTFAANALDAIPSELEEASAILGAPAWRTALHVTLPLVLPALLGGFIVAFLQSMTLFGTPAILALPAGIDTMTTKIWSLFQFPPQLGLAAAASLPLLVITVALLRAQSAIMGRRGYSVIGGKSGSAGQPIRLRGWKVPALALFVVVLGCSIALPYGVFVRTAFVRNWSAPLEGNLSLEHWRFVFLEFSQTRLALQNTFVLGVTAATAGTLLVTLVGYLSLRKLVWGHRYLAFLATAPVAIPGIVLAVGLFLSYTHPPLVLYGTLSIIFLAYVTKELPVGYQQIAGSLRAVHPELEDASRIFGATRLRALFDITTPLIRNGVIATWIFIFIGSIRELSATILLFTARTKTISVTMFDLRESNDWGPIAVLSITMLVITFVMIAIIHRFTDARLK
ncbi:MAG TPA: iron ABC transporter permease [Casimicrobiaceae bacterium]|jgi:iron(III) transport system permease protein|nr:iron ABC transporter permease [Casimicrobiaceae bacterium]